MQVANARQLTADLRGRTPHNWLIESQRLTAAEAGRIVTLARWLPLRPQLAEVLDIGRATRVWPTAIRKALQREDNGCGWPGCKMPIWACRIHHILWWERDHGTTGKRNGVHLCRADHPEPIRRSRTLSCQHLRVL